MLSHISNFTYTSSFCNFFKKWFRRLSSFSQDLPGHAARVHIWDLVSLKTHSHSNAFTRFQGQLARGGSIIKTQIFLYCLSLCSPFPQYPHSPSPQPAYTLCLPHSIVFSQPPQLQALVSLRQIPQSLLVLFVTGEPIKQLDRHPCGRLQGMTAKRTPMVPRARQEIMVSMIFLLLFWEEWRLRRGQQGSEAQVTGIPHVKAFNT